MSGKEWESEKEYDVKKKCEGSNIKPCSENEKRLIDRLIDRF